VDEETPQSCTFSANDVVEVMGHGKGRRRKRLHMEK
jgi:hypothetical protein